MADFFEIDILPVETKKSGDALALRYRLDGLTWVHVVDGGYQSTGPAVVEHIAKYYDGATYIDNVVVTHPDGDHAGGLRTVLEECEVGTLWMLRPWLYAAEIIDRFTRFSSVENLERRLREVYPNLVALEEIAIRKGIPIEDPFQGTTIGHFHVLAPTKARYLDLVVASERTPESVKEAEETALTKVGSFFEATAARLVNLVKAAWGEESFSTQETSAENEMSVVQYAELLGERIVLTGDAGRAGLAEAADYAPLVGLQLPGVDRFQVPHHASRRNVSTELLDRWLGPRLATQPARGEEKFTAFISSALEDPDHPRDSVVRALIHRGARVIATEGVGKRTGHNAPRRDGWVAATPLAYPEANEE
ncbi:MBL fold metallo-hydrolase [Brevundimonas sp. 2R-24]|uniref:MBL fold metallo-hydrolase n=1 Tax=Peiella sedimenti TaxID=3061083 RepID=A0ABT8SNG9_9CAUL|nr:MBL fold metallo-hydrolase [Caulobacteraceae bacterium XZ-24]